jgi:hypothetical protein
MTSHELAGLLLRFPAVPVCVQDGAMLREVERVRATSACYLPPLDDALLAAGMVLIVEGLPDA